MDTKDDKPKKTWRRGRYPEGPTAKIVTLTARVSALEMAELKRLAAEKGVSLTDLVLTPVRRMLAKEGFKNECIQKTADKPGRKKNR